MTHDATAAAMPRARAAAALARLAASIQQQSNDNAFLAFVTATFGTEILGALVKAGILDREDIARLVDAYADEIAQFPAESTLGKYFADYFAQAATLIREGAH